jgi:hypothetical protein
VALMHDWDAVVIGTGAGGLVAAFRAAERGRRTLLLEKNRKPGAKILMSGGTCCNLALQEPLEGLERSGDGFRLATPLRALSAGELILTPGATANLGEDGHAKDDNMLMEVDTDTLHGFDSLCGNTVVHLPPAYHVFKGKPVGSASFLIAAPYQLRKSCCE